MQDRFTRIDFDRNKGPAIDFDILTLDNIQKRRDLDHNPLDPHKVSFYVLLVITSGKGKHTIDFKEYNYSEGSVLTIRKDQVHNFHYTKAGGYVLLFTEEYVLSYLERPSAEKIRELFNELFYNQHTRLSASELQALLVIINQMQEEFSQHLDQHTSGIIRNLLQILVSKIHRTRSKSLDSKFDHKYTSQFMELQQLVEKNCHQFRSVQYYADQLNVTTRTLNNITQKMVNKSCKTFIDETLVLQIKRLLINTRWSIKEIAYKSGFEEPTNLFKYFRRFTAQTPESFRAHFSKRN